MAWLRAIPRKQWDSVITAALEKVKLQDHSATRVKDLSGGMKRRLLIASSLLDSPQFLILDEPTAGLDPKHRKEITSILRSLVDAGVPVLMSTHIATDVEETDRVLFISEGRIVSDGPVPEFKEKFGGIDEAFNSF